MLDSAFTLFQVGTSILSGKGERSLDRARVRAEQSVIDAQGRVRNASNFRAAAQADLGRFMQSYSNRRTRKQATDRQATALAAVLAQRDSLTAGNAERRLAAAEQAGGLAVAAARAGVVGGSYDVMQGAIALQTARQEFSANRAGRARDYGLTVDSTEAARSAITGLDNRTLFATIDRTVDAQAQRRVQGNWVQDVAKSGVKAADLAQAVEGIYNAAKPYTDRLLDYTGLSTKFDEYFGDKGGKT